MAQCLASADRPVIVTSRTGARPDAVASLVEVAEILGCPVLDHRDRLSFPPGHPLCAGESGEVLTDADVVLILDTEVPWIPVHAAPPPDATVLQIDIDPVKASMPTWAYPVDLSLTADTAVALPMLAEELRRLLTPARAERWTARREQVTARLEDLRRSWAALARSPEPDAAPDVMLHALNRVLPPDAIVLEEAVTNRPAVLRQIVREPGGYYATGSPALGWAVAGAMGVKLARPQAPVIAICGDGVVQFQRAHLRHLVGAAGGRPVRGRHPEQPRLPGVEAARAAPVPGRRRRRRGQLPRDRPGSRAQLHRPRPRLRRRRPGGAQPRGTARGARVLPRPWRPTAAAASSTSSSRPADRSGGSGYRVAAASAARMVSALAGVPAGCSKGPYGAP